MTINQAVGVISDIQGTELTSEDCDFLAQPEIAGMILFARNYESPKQLQALTQSVKTLRHDLLITVDQEGGRVQRFREGFSRFAPMLNFEALYLAQPDQALKLAEEAGWLLATELIMHGVDLSFCPVLDIERDCSRVIGDRAFGHTAEAVTALAQAWVQGLTRAGMKSVGKHFPGHGAVVADSHHELPIDSRNLTELEYDIQPFKQLIANNSLAGIMPAHVIYPDVDKDNTAGFSPVWLQSILRSQLGFDGVIFSDDLSMQGAASVGSPGQRAFAAASAGANALVVCNQREASIEVIQKVKEMHEQGAQRLSLADWIPSNVTDSSSSTLLDDTRLNLTQAGVILS